MRKINLGLEIDSIGAKSGWMKCWLVINGERHQILATSVFPPFNDVLNFIHAIATGNLPHEFFWEEEGHGAKFRASHSVLGSNHVHVYINHDGEVLVEANLEQGKLAHTFMDALRGFALDCPGAETEWHFPYFLIENFEQELSQGFTPKSNGVSVPRFIFGHYGGYGGQSYPSCALWLDNRRAFYFDPGDIPRLWWLWFELLKKVAKGDLPLETSFDEAEDEKSEDALMLFPFQGSRTWLLADWLPDEENFQLKVTRRSDLQPKPYTFLDATIERRAFVRAFLESFDKFIEMNYQVYLESEEHAFDLHELPWDNLKDLVK